MSQELMPFAFEGRDVRVIMIDGEPWWVAADVCAVLGYANGRAAIAQHVPSQHRSTVANHDGAGGPERVIISEPGLYRLIMRSNASNAEAFQDWVFVEVLPTIRKTGGYGRQVALPADYPAALEELAAEVRKRHALEQEVDTVRAIAAEQEPKVQAWDRLIQSDGLFDMGVVAKAFGTGSVRLFAFLRRHRVLISLAGDRYNTPYQHHVEAGRFEVKMGTRPDRDGNERSTWTTKVTPRGVDYIRRLIDQHGRPGA